MDMRKVLFLIGSTIILLGLLFSCKKEGVSGDDADVDVPEESIEEEIVQEQQPKVLTANDIQLTKDLLYDKYTLEDIYEYKDTVRSFKWQTIKEYLAIVENHHDRPERWGVLQNYKNKNREAPLVHTWHRDEYRLVSDSLGIQRYQSAPLYSISDSIVPRRYGRDGSPFHLLDSIGSFYKLSLIDSDEEWLTKKRYVQLLPDTIKFDHVIFVDVSDQNITALQRQSSGNWVVRSMNPATSGKHGPPYAHETPLGIFLVQQKKRKMYYLKDGTSEIAGYAPYASRFTNGAYVHGVPVNGIDASEIEYSRTLGTVPRSHMCVRNATSHAKFVYDWAPTLASLVIVIE